MKNKKTVLGALFLTAALSVGAQYSHTVNADNLGRGVLAVKGDKGVFVSWRSLPEDAKGLLFDVYRDGVKVNADPLADGTNFSDPDGTADGKYVVKAILDGNVVETSAETATWGDTYLRLHLDRPEGGESPAGGAKEDRVYTYTPDDVSVGDVDGDGEYEYIVKWFPTNAADNSHTRYTGNTILDCYKLDGTKLWRIDLGHNIRSGNHYTQFMVYDFDGDGKAELICKTAPGTIDGAGNAVLMGDDQVTDDFRKSDGTVMSGPEYLTVFNGLTGAEINTIAYNPPRSIRKHDKSSTGWGDNYGNRCERYLAGVAYLDGVKPSAVFVRGYYTASYVWAVDFDGEKLTEKWLHKSESVGSNSIYGQGSHSLSIADLDGDGCDEIIIGSGAVDHDGAFLHTTGAGHGDALHVGDFLPDREGLEIYMPHEDTSNKWATTLRDGRTGEIIYGIPQAGKDVGRGLIANVTSKYMGYEYWSTNNSDVMNYGEVVGTKRPSVNFRIYWDGDLLDELLDGTSITKPNYDLTSISTLKGFAANGAESCNTTKATPNLQADLFGDWREEVIFHDKNQEDLLIFTTTTPTEWRVPSLMTDRQYRVAIAWQNVAYNQPPHLSYNLEEKFNTKAMLSVTQGVLNQSVLLGEAIGDICFKTIRATGAEVKDLPAGLKYEFNAETLTGSIFGTPEAVGEYPFTITSTGSEDGSVATLEGMITVRQPSTLTILADFPMDEIANGEVKNMVTGAATVVGSVSAAQGVKNGAIEFDGSGYLTQPIYDDLQVGAESFTVELWMKSTDEDCYLFCIGTHNHDNVAGGTGNWIGLERVASSSRFNFSIDDDKTKTDCGASNHALAFDGEWHHIACVRDASAGETRLYIDGKLDMTKTGVGTGAINFSSSELFFIGGDDEPTAGREHRTFEGTLDELKVYPRALAADEIKESYESLDPNAVMEMLAGVSGIVTVTDAMTGIVVATVAAADFESLTVGLEKGIYIAAANGHSRKFLVK